MINPNSIKIWNITYTDNNVKVLSRLLNDSTSYLLDRKNNTNIFMNVINKLLVQQEKEKEETFVEFWKPDTSISSFHISYIKKENITYEHPLETFVLFLSDDTPSIISMDLDLDQYKYKTIIIPTKKGKLVSINPNHFYGFHSFHPNQNTNCNILMINIWKTKPPYLEYYNFDTNIFNEKDIPLEIEEEQQTIYLENTIFNEQFYEQLLYKKNYQILGHLYSQINENYPQINIAATNLIIHSQKTPLKNTKYFQEKREKYGNIMKDIYEIEINKVTPTNMLQKINIPFFFSPPIIDWYNIELNKNDNLWQPIENNVSKFSLNSLPYLSTFIFSHTEIIVNRIKEIYQLGRLNIQINNYFIEKLHFELDKNTKIDKTNNSFITFFIILKGSMNISFEKEQNHMYIVNRGDLIVFGGENYTIKSSGIEDIIVLGGNIEYTI